MTEPMPDGVHTYFAYRPEPNRLSPNGAKKLLPPSTPAKFDYDRKNPQKSKRVWDFGNVAHKIVLGEGDQFLILDPEIHGLKKDGTPADKPTATDAWKDAEANARAEGLTPIHVDDHRKAVEMAQVVHQHEDAGPLLADGDAEPWLYWTDAESGQGLRQRLDWMTRGGGKLTIVEYKTAADASLEAFNRIVFKLGYHIAAAFALAGAKTLGLAESVDYVIVAQEKEPPYQVSVHELDDEALYYSNQQMRQAITIFQRCMETGQWPGYRRGRNQIRLPMWLIDDEEMEIPA
ncbi:MAG: PD-(D/E)XK nuclease-like domain-containing protein [Actinomycetota bacterium]|nr:PD-(D/E)XK nuclease-like domain-containing protein [Actinomycetota bacterium]